MSAREATLGIGAVASAVSKGQLRTGWGITGFCALFLLFDGIARAVHFGPYLEGTIRAGFDASLSAPIGILLVLCTLFYLLPRTAVLGAVLLTAYLGAGTAVNLRIGDPFWFPVLFGVAVWAGIYLREPRLAALLPFRTVRG
jgi:hypothetical protein